MALFSRLTVVRTLPEGIERADGGSRVPQQGGPDFDDIGQIAAYLLEHGSVVIGVGLADAWELVVLRPRCV